MLKEILISIKGKEARYPVCNLCVVADPKVMKMNDMTVKINHDTGGQIIKADGYYLLKDCKIDGQKVDRLAVPVESMVEGNVDERLSSTDFSYMTLDMLSVN